MSGNKYTNSNSTIAAAESYDMTVEKYEEELKGDISRKKTLYGTNHCRAVFLYLFAQHMTISRTIRCMREYDARYAKIKDRIVNWWLSDEDLPTFQKIFSQLCVQTPQDFTDSLRFWQKETQATIDGAYLRFLDHTEDSSEQLAKLAKAYCKSEDEEERRRIKENMAVYGDVATICTRIIEKSGITRNNLTINGDALAQINSRLAAKISIISPYDDTDGTGDNCVQE